MPSAWYMRKLAEESEDPRISTLEHNIEMASRQHKCELRLEVCSWVEYDRMQESWWARTFGNLQYKNFKDLVRIKTPEDIVKYFVPEYRNIIVWLLDQKYALHLVREYRCFCGGSTMIIIMVVNW